MFNSQEQLKKGFIDKCPICGKIADINILEECIMYEQPIPKDIQYLYECICRENSFMYDIKFNEYVDYCIGDFIYYHPKRTVYKITKYSENERITITSADGASYEYAESTISWHSTNLTFEKLKIDKIIQITQQNQSSKNKKYIAKSSLTEAEKIFLEKLKLVIDKNKYKIETQKSLRQMIEKKTEKEMAYELNRDIDFVIVNNNYENVLLIEYNDSTHDDPKRIKRDNDIKEICDDANLKLIFIKRNDNMSTEYLRGKLEEYL